MKRLLVFLAALIGTTACNRQKELTDEEKAAALRKSDSDLAEKLATGREDEARKDLIEKAKDGNGSK